MPSVLQFNGRRTSPVRVLLGEDALPVAFFIFNDLEERC